MSENKMRFEEPEIQVLKLQVVDVVTTSDDMDWGAGEF